MVRVLVTTNATSLIGFPGGEAGYWYDFLPAAIQQSGTEVEVVKPDELQAKFVRGQDVVLLLGSVAQDGTKENDQIFAGTNGLKKITNVKDSFGQFVILSTQKIEPGKSVSAHVRHVMGFPSNTNATTLSKTPSLVDEANRFVLPYPDHTVRKEEEIRNIVAALELRFKNIPALPAETPVVDKIGKKPAVVSSSTAPQVDTAAPATEPAAAPASDANGAEPVNLSATGADAAAEIAKIDQWKGDSPLMCVYDGNVKFNQLPGGRKQPVVKHLKDTVRTKNFDAKLVEIRNSANTAPQSPPEPTADELEPVALKQPVTLPKVPDALLPSPVPQMTATNSAVNLSATGADAAAEIAKIDQWKGDSPLMCVYDGNVKFEQLPGGRKQPVVKHLKDTIRVKKFNAKWVEISNSANTAPRLPSPSAPQPPGGGNNGPGPLPSATPQPASTGPQPLRPAQSPGAQQPLQPAPQPGPSAPNPKSYVEPLNKYPIKIIKSSVGSTLQVSNTYGVMDLAQLTTALRSSGGNLAEQMSDVFYDLPTVFRADPMAADRNIENKVQKFWNEKALKHREPTMQTLRWALQPLARVMPSLTETLFGGSNAVFAVRNRFHTCAVRILGTDKREKHVIWLCDFFIAMCIVRPVPPLKMVTDAQYWLIETPSSVPTSGGGGGKPTPQSNGGQAIRGNPPNTWMQQFSAGSGSGQQSTAGGGGTQYQYQQHQQHQQQPFAGNGNGQQSTASYTSTAGDDGQQPSAMPGSPSATTVGNGQPQHQHQFMQPPGVNQSPIGGSPPAASNSQQMAFDSATQQQPVVTPDATGLQQPSGPAATGPATTGPTIYTADPIQFPPAYMAASIYPNGTSLYSSLFTETNNGQFDFMSGTTLPAAPTQPPVPIYDDVLIKQEILNIASENRRDDIQKLFDNPTLTLGDNIKSLGLVRTRENKIVIHTKPDDYDAIDKKVTTLQSVFDAVSHDESNRIQNSDEFKAYSKLYFAYHKYRWINLYQTPVELDANLVNRITDKTGIRLKVVDNRVVKVTPIDDLKTAIKSEINGLTDAEVQYLAEHQAELSGYGLRISSIGGVVDDMGEKQYNSTMASVADLEEKNQQNTATYQGVKSRLEKLKMRTRRGEWDQRRTAQSKPQDIVAERKEKIINMIVENHRNDVRGMFINMGINEVLADLGLEFASGGSQIVRVDDQQYTARRSEIAAVNAMCEYVRAKKPAQLQQFIACIDSTVWAARDQFAQYEWVTARASEHVDLNVDRVNRVSTAAYDAGMGFKLAVKDNKIVEMSQEDVLVTEAMGFLNPTVTATEIRQILKNQDELKLYGLKLDMASGGHVKDDNGEQAYARAVFATSHLLSRVGNGTPVYLSYSDKLSKLEKRKSIEEWKSKKVKVESQDEFRATLDSQLQRELPVPQVYQQFESLMNKINHAGSRAALGALATKIKEIYAVNLLKQYTDLGFQTLQVIETLINDSSKFALKLSPGLQIDRVEFIELQLGDRIAKFVPLQFQEKIALFNTQLTQTLDNAQAMSYEWLDRALNIQATNVYTTENLQKLQAMFPVDQETGLTSYSEQLAKLEEFVKQDYAGDAQIQPAKTSVFAAQCKTLWNERKEKVAEITIKVEKTAKLDQKLKKSEDADKLVLEDVSGSIFLSSGKKGWLTAALLKRLKTDPGENEQAVQANRLLIANAEYCDSDWIKRAHEALGKALNLKKLDRQITDQESASRLIDSGSVSGSAELPASKKVLLKEALFHLLKTDSTITAKKRSSMIDSAEYLTDSDKEEARKPVAVLSSDVEENKQRGGGSSGLPELNPADIDPALRALGEEGVTLDEDLSNVVDAPGIGVASQATERPDGSKVDNPAATTTEPGAQQATASGGAAPAATANTPEEQAFADRILKFANNAEGGDRGPDGITWTNYKHRFAQLKMEGLTNETIKADAQAWFKTNEGRLLEIASKFLEKFASDDAQSGDATSMTAGRALRSSSVQPSERASSQPPTDSAAPTANIITDNDFKETDRPAGFSPNKRDIVRVEVDSEKRFGVVVGTPIKGNQYTVDLFSGNRERKRPTIDLLAPAMILTTDPTKLAEINTRIQAVKVK